MKKLMHTPNTPSVENVIKKHQDNQAKELASLQDCNTVQLAFQEVLSVWRSDRYRRGWGRFVRLYRFSTQSLEADLYLAPSDSLSSLITLFEAFESLLPGLEWTSTSDISFGRSYFAEYNGIEIEFEVHVDQSASCKVVPVYETKQVQVGTRVICSGETI